MEQCKVELLEAVRKHAIEQARLWADVVAMLEATDDVRAAIDAVEAAAMLDVVIINWLRVYHYSDDAYEWEV